MLAQRGLMNATLCFLKTARSVVDEVDKMLEEAT
ncbi:hypothetical protein FVEN_g13042 [Fusarium venenatum]|nr:hypothetical protein FVEN_g13042 [Fusarium venenatum]